MKKQRVSERHMIRGKSINLRAIEAQDLETIINLKNNVNETGEYGNISVRSINQLRKGFNEHGFTQRDLEMLLITDKDDQIVGMIQRAKQQSYTTGYEIGFIIYQSDHRGKGYGTEALRLFSSYVFESQPVERLELATHINNIGAQRVAEKCGYSFEGINRKACYIRGVASDLKRYSMLRNETVPLEMLLE